MRKIERQMLGAIAGRRSFSSANTQVSYIEAADYPERAQVFLHGNHIATYIYCDGSLKVNEYTLSRWPSVTTKSRLRALGADVHTKDRVTYLNGKPV